MTTRILINAPNNSQVLTEIQEGGGYFDPARVLWDERIDGPMPAVTLGGMKRVGNALVYDAALYASHDTTILRPALKVNVSAKRYTVEVAGINFTYRTVARPVSTSRDSQSAIDVARNRVRDNEWAGGVPGAEEQFKFADGVFRPATSDEVTAISTAVRNHRKACFSVEQQKYAEIDATGTTDVDTGWPATANTPTTIYFGK